MVSYACNYHLAIFKRPNRINPANAGLRAELEVSPHGNSKTVYFLIILCFEYIHYRRGTFWSIICLVILSKPLLVNLEFCYHCRVGILLLPTNLPHPYLSSRALPWNKIANAVLLHRRNTSLKPNTIIQSCVYHWCMLPILDQWFCPCYHIKTQWCNLVCVSFDVSVWHAQVEGLTWPYARDFRSGFDTYYESKSEDIA